MSSFSGGEPTPWRARGREKVLSLPLLASRGAPQEPRGTLWETPVPFSAKSGGYREGTRCTCAALRALSLSSSLHAEAIQRKRIPKSCGTLKGFPLPTLPLPLSPRRERERNWGPETLQSLPAIVQNTDAPVDRVKGGHRGHSLLLLWREGGSLGEKEKPNPPSSRWGARRSLSLARETLLCALPPMTIKGIVRC